MTSSVFKLSFISLAACLVSIPALAATPYVGATLGASYATQNQSLQQITYVSGVGITDAYPVNDNQVSALNFSLNGGYEFSGDNHLKPAIAIGLGFYNTPVGYDFTGTVIETVAGSPPSTLFNYTYNLYNIRLMAEAQFTWQLGLVAPFINIGVGPGWNRANGYTETPLTPVGFAGQPPFQSNTNVVFAYQAGLGISTTIHQERIAIGYRYVNLGQTTLGTRGPTYPYSLKTGSLYTNDVYLSYTHLFQG